MVLEVLSSDLEGWIGRGKTGKMSISHCRSIVGAAPSWQPAHVEGPADGVLHVVYRPAQGAEKGGDTGFAEVTHLRQGHTGLL
jgi:hypothetical protein